MDKKEMGERIAELTNKDGKVLLDDFAKLVFEKDSPDDVLKKFMEEAPKLVKLQNLWGDLQKTVVSFNTSKKLERGAMFQRSAYCIKGAFHVNIDKHF